MKVCIVTHKLLKGDGQARVNYELVKELQKSDCKITLLASEVAPELLAHPATEWMKIPVNGWPTQLLRNLIYSLISTWKLFPVRRSFDVLMVNGFITWIRSDVNAVHFVHSSWLKSAAHPFRHHKNIVGLYQLLFTSLNAILERIAFSRSEYLVPVSGNVKREVQAAGIRTEMRVIMNGVDTSEFYPDESTDRKSLGLPVGVPLALFAGDIRSSRKNLDTVLKALLSVPRLHLAVAGATEGSSYMQMSERLGLSERVHFLGFRSDLARIMSGADFFLFPSRYDPFGLAAAEALSTGLPVITTRQTGVAELVVSDKDSGFVLDDSEDAVALSKAMSSLTEDKELRIRQGRNAREVALKQSWKSVSDQYIQLFHEVRLNKEHRLQQSLRVEV